MGNVWVLWKDICRCLCQSESQSVSASLHQSGKLADRELWLQWGKRPPGEYLLSTSFQKRRHMALKITQSSPQWASSWEPHQPRSRSAKWDLKDNTAWYGQEKKLWVNITVYICLPVSLTHHRSFNPFQK